VSRIALALLLLLAGFGLWLAKVLPAGEQGPLQLEADSVIVRVLVSDDDRHEVWSRLPGKGYAVEFHGKNSGAITLSGRK
jgi:hypothetical protein